MLTSKIRSTRGKGDLTVMFLAFVSACTCTGSKDGDSGRRVPNGGYCRLEYLQVVVFSCDCFPNMPGSRFPFCTSSGACRDGFRQDLRHYTRSFRQEVPVGELIRDGKENTVYDGTQYTQ